MTTRDRSEGSTFGARFGRLIRSYRDDLGLSARDLAVRVWEDEGRKATISRLENGRVSRPEAKTVQSIAHALDIPQEEIDRLREPSPAGSGSLAPHLEGLSWAGRDLLEALATRFEIEHVYERPDAELRKLLELKAEEYRTYRRVEGADRVRSSTVHLRAKADEAIRRLDFEAGEALLGAADLAETRTLVDIREARGRNALLRGRVDQAFAIFDAAADAFRSLNMLEMTRRRHRYYQQLLQHGLRYGGVGLDRAVDILRPAVQALEDSEWRDEWARSLKDLGNALAHLGDRTEGAEGAALIETAVDAYERVLDHFTAEIDPRLWAMTQQNLGGALYLLHDKAETPAEKLSHLEEAIAAYRRALTVRRRNTAPYEWAMTMQNLAVALQDWGEITSGPEGHASIREAIFHFEQALTVRTRSEHPFDWAMTCENLARAEALLASHVFSNNPDLHRSAALAHIEAALGVYSRETSPVFFEKAVALRDALRKAQRQED